MCFAIPKNTSTDDTCVIARTDRADQRQHARKCAVAEIGTGPPASAIAAMRTASHRSYEHGGGTNANSRRCDMHNGLTNRQHHEYYQRC